jgi:ketosteroid isomerase-like protein
LSSAPNSNTDSAVSKIAALRKAWSAALQREDANGLGALMTDDVVFVYGNGRCVCGKEELQVDILHRFERFDFERRSSRAELVVRDKWAVEISEVESNLTAVRGGIQVHANSKTVIAFARQPDTSWKVARIVELLH